MTRRNLIPTIHPIPGSRAFVTFAPLIPTEPLEHNDKAPAGAAEGPPFTDDDKVMQTLGGTLIPGTDLDESFGVPIAQDWEEIYSPTKRALKSERFSSFV